jgi:hypothetical protein
MSQAQGGEPQLNDKVAPSSSSGRADREVEINIRELIDRYLKPSTSFDLIEPIYDHVVYTARNEMLSGIEKKYSIYEASATLNSSKILILDENDIVVSGIRKYSLKYKDPRFINKLPDDQKAVYEKVAKRWGIMKTRLASGFDNKIYGPVYRLDPHFELPKGIDWKEFINQLINYKSAKDPRLVLFFKALLLRGFVMKYSPHTIMATNVGTGKSAFLGNVGSRYEKISANSLVGFSKGREEVHQGAINNQKFTITIEEVEAQMFGNFFSFLLTFLEEGRARVSTGGVEFEESGTCPFAITANPNALELNREDSAKLLLIKLSTNHLALGRRIGLLIFGNDYKSVVSKGGFDEVEWKMFFEFYRAIEEFCAPTIAKYIYGAKDVEQWLETPIEGYNKKLLEAYKVQDPDVADFLTAHLDQAFRHIRGGALAIAIVDNMDKLIELAELRTDVPPRLLRRILGDAEEALREIVMINLNSIRNMVSTIQRTPEMDKVIFMHLPKHIQETVLLVKNIKASSPSKGVFKVKDTKEYLPHDKYTNVDDLSRDLLFGYEQFRDILRSSFGFDIQVLEGDISVILTDKTEITVSSRDGKSR